MLTLPRSFVRRLAKLFRRALAGTPDPFAHPVQFSAGSHGLTIHVVHSQGAVEYRESTPQPQRELSASLSLLRQLAARNSEPVTLVVNDEARVRARWHSGRLPRVVDDPVWPLATADPLPPLPDRWKENPPNLWTALGAASRATQPPLESPRRGVIQCLVGTGALAGTDGTQLFYERGFSFPGEDDWALGSSPLWGCRELRRARSVLVGRTEQHVVLRAGHWTLWQPLLRGSFPPVAHIVAAATHRPPTTTLRLSPAERRFLRTCLPRLPSDAPYEPVTLEVNGRVVVRTRANSSPLPKELVLRAADYAGPPQTIVSLRHYLQRALDLGFHTFEMRDSDSPIACRDHHRLYLWMPLSADLALRSVPGALTLERFSSIMPEASLGLARESILHSVATTSRRNADPDGRSAP